MGINSKINGVDVKTAISALEKGRDMALDSGKMNKPQTLNKIISVIQADNSIMPEMMRLAVHRFCDGKSPIGDEVKRTWQPEYKEKLSKYFTNGFLQNKDDRHADGYLSLEETFRLIDGYYNRAKEDKNTIRMKMFTKAKLYLQNNIDKATVICDFLHYVLGQVPGGSVPYTYRAKSWDNEYFKVLIDLRNSGEIFNGDKI